MASELFEELLPSDAELINGGNPGAGALYKENEAPGLGKVAAKGITPIAVLDNGHYYSIKGTQRWDSY